MANLTYTQRTDNEWFDLINECRRSGMSDAGWCRLNHVCPSSFYSAVKRLRKRSFAIPPRDDGIHDLTVSGQDVVKVDIVNDIMPPKAIKPEPAVSHIDNSHTIEIILGNANIRISNNADPVLLTKALRILGGMS